MIRQRSRGLGATPQRRPERMGCDSGPRCLHSGVAILIIGIDTQILIYAGAVPPKPGKKSVDMIDLRERARLLICQATERHDTIVIPAVAVSELLIPVPPGQRSSVVQVLERNFRCQPFDIPSAVLAADVWARFKGIPQDGNDSSNRSVLRADALIVASARVANAIHFYSHDRQCRKLAELAGMKGLDLPVPRELKDQYLLLDIRSDTVPEITEKAPRKKRQRSNDR